MHSNGADCWLIDDFITLCTSKNSFWPPKYIVVLLNVRLKSYFFWPPNTVTPAKQKYKDNKFSQSYRTKTNIITGITYEV